MVLATLKVYFIQVFLTFSIIIKILCYTDSRYISMVYLLAFSVNNSKADDTGQALVLI